MSITTTTNGRAPRAETDEVPIKLQRLDRITFEVAIRGTAPLIVNRFSEKAKQQMLDGQQTPKGGKAKAPREAKDPVACFEGSRYRMDDGRDGFPAAAFKAAMIGACRQYDGLTMTSLKAIVTVLGDGQNLVPIDYGELTMREDAVRNASGVADLRYRAQYWPWSVLLRIQTIANRIDHESVLALVDTGGLGGVGEWRPSGPKSATGTYGTFEVIE